MAIRTRICNNLLHCMGHIYIVLQMVTDITGIFLPLICRNMEAIFMFYYIIFILLGDLCEVKFSGRIIPVMSVSIGS